MRDEAVRSILKLLAVTIWSGCTARRETASTQTSNVRADGPVTVEDLVRRAQIPLVALSPDGRFAAYLLARGDPVRNDYELTIRVVDTEGESATPVTVRRYRVPPRETFNQLDWLEPGAAEMRWVRDDLLLFVGRSGAKPQLATWSAKNRKVAVVLEGRDRIEFERASEGDSVVIVTTDVIPSPFDSATTPADHAWRIGDGVRFVGSLDNPKAGRRVREQRFAYSPNRRPALTPVETPVERWESVPDETSFPPPVVVGDSSAFTWEEAQSPDRKWVAAMEIRSMNLRRPDSVYGDFRIIAKGEADTRVLVPGTRPYAMARTVMLGWSADSQALYYLFVSPRTTFLNRVTLDGQIATVWSGPELLAKPFPPIRKYQFMSRDGRFALLIRSSNVNPGEVVKVDLQSGKQTLLESPDGAFRAKTLPEVRVYDIGGTGGDAWGRLYLPIGYREGVRVPVVFTQYESSPGFGMATGDEIPFLPLTAHGIAVFDMNSGGLSDAGTGGNFAADLSRVRRPVAGMQWIARKLVAEGIVDSSRIGLAGLSYGAEIAMYAYWSWKELRAVSAATASWDPTVYLFAGPNYSRHLDDRGFTGPDEAGLRRWRMLAAGLNARADLPPLLLQSPDAEINFTVPTWTQLRRAGAPVEWYEYPNEGHVKVHPANRWWVYQRNLDWFRFWLQDAEDPKPLESERYVRWRRLRSGDPGRG